MDPAPKALEVQSPMTSTQRGHSKAAQERVREGVVGALVTASESSPRGGLSTVIHKPPTIVSVVAGPPHPIKAAPLDHALKHLGAHHVILDLGYRHNQVSNHLYRWLNLPDPITHLALEIVFKNNAATNVDYEKVMIANALAPLKPRAVVVYGDLPGSVAAAMAAQS
jgi:hypothetical protein